MIRKVTLRNFESHEDSAVEFSDGLNLLIGQSNQGKSSLVRAIALVCANRFDKESVRTGCEFCTVSVETDKGIVAAERGEKTNRWTVTDKDGKTTEYRNIGTGMPPGAAEVLGMGERTHGGITELPNIMFQLEKHYMLAEIDGRRATSNMIARMMDEAIGIGGMEELVLAMANDMAAAKKELNAVCGSAEQLRAKAVTAEDFQAAEDAVKKTCSLRERCEGMEKRLQALDSLSSEIAAAERRLPALDERLRMTDRVATAFRECETAYRRLSLLERLSVSERRLDELVRRLDASSIVAGIFAKCEDSYRRIALLERSLSLSEKLRALSAHAIDVERLESLLALCSETLASLSKAAERSTDLESAERRLSEHSCRAESSAAEEEAARRTLAELELELGRCPLCGSEFSEPRL